MQELMLYQELPRIESDPLDGWGRWLVPALVAAARSRLRVVPVWSAQPLIARLRGAGGMASAAFAFSRRSGGERGRRAARCRPGLCPRRFGARPEPRSRRADDRRRVAADSQRRLSRAIRRSAPPLELATRRGRAGRACDSPSPWRGGMERAALPELRPAPARSRSRSNGSAREATSAVAIPRNRRRPIPWRPPFSRIDGATGERLARPASSRRWSTPTADPAANPPFLERALAPDDSRGSSRFGELVELGDDGQMRLRAEGEGAAPFRAVHVPADRPTRRRRDLPDVRPAASGVGRPVVEPADPARRPSHRAGAGRSRWPVPDHERGVSAGGGDQGSTRCRSIPATSSLRKTKRRLPMPCAATRAARRCRAISRSAWRASPRSRSR